MKKFLFSLALVATLCSCGNNGPRDYYFMDNEQKMQNNPEAEFDTLSYAIGMNFGMNLFVQQKDINYIGDIVYQAIEDEVMKEVVDLEFIKQNRAKMVKYNKEYIRPYMMAKQSNMRKLMMNPEATDTVEIPELYNEEFTPEVVSQNIGYDMGNHLREVSYPANLHWIFKAMKDAESLNGIVSANDSTLMLSPVMMTQALRKYYTEDLLTINAERSRKWIANIATKSDVEPLIVANDTLYYRIENLGNDIKPTQLTDTVQITYEVYTSRGVLIESTNDRAQSVRDNIAEVREDANITDSVRNIRIAELEERLDKVAKPKMPISFLKLRGAQECLQLIGEQGEVTIWMPASMAYGTQGNRSVQPNEAVVMNIQLHRVAEGVANDNLTPRPGNGIIKTLPQKDAMKAGKPVVINPVPEKKELTPTTK